MTWTAYVVAFSVGLAVGVAYGVLNVRSPAPPIIALIGLLGILAGEQIPTLVKRLLDGQIISLSVLKEECSHHVLGPLPSRTQFDDPQKETST